MFFFFGDVCPNVYDEAILSLFNDSNYQWDNFGLTLFSNFSPYIFSLYNYSKPSQ